MGKEEAIKLAPRWGLNFRSPWGEAKVLHFEYTGQKVVSVAWSRRAGFPAHTLV
jgi:hypothetical protein